MFVCFDNDFINVKSFSNTVVHLFTFLFSMSVFMSYLHPLNLNNVIMKFPVTLKPGYNIEKDELKFGFYLHIKLQKSSTQSLELKVPIMLNTGKLKINTSGGAYVSSAESVASAKKVT